MNNRQLNILIISLILMGPVVTSFSVLADGFYFTLYLFPITIDSLSFPLSLIGWIIPLFFIKVLFIGAICLLRLLWKKSPENLLLRFYILVLIICVIKIIGHIVYMPESRVDFVAGIIGLISFTSASIWAISNQRSSRRSNAEPVDL